MLRRCCWSLLLISLGCGGRTSADLDPFEDGSATPYDEVEPSSGGAGVMGGSSPTGGITGAGGRVARGGAATGGYVGGGYVGGGYVGGGYVGGGYVGGGYVGRAGAAPYGGQRPSGGITGYGGSVRRGGATGYGGFVARGGVAPYGGVSPAGGRSGGTGAGGYGPIAGRAPADAGPDAGPACGPSGQNLVVLDSNETLHSVVIPTLESRLIGKLDCGVGLNSLAISSRGEAYVSSGMGNLYRVDTATAHCEPTPFVPTAPAVGRYGIGFSRGPDQLEVLRFSAGSPDNSIGVIDLGDYGLRDVVALDPVMDPGEIHGGPDGAVYLFAKPGTKGGLYLVDPASGSWKLIAELPPGSPNLNSFDFTVLGGSFFLFGSSSSSSGATLSRYDPGAGTMVTLGTLPFAVIGAGTVSCRGARDG